MFSLTRRCLGRNMRAHSKFPAMVSYHRLPWEQVSAHHFRLHEAVSMHYAQLFDLAAQRHIPDLVVEQHVVLPEDMTLRLLPGALYLLPNDASGEAVLPDGWTKQLVEDSVATQFYGHISSRQLGLKSVATGTSADLRIFCNILTFDSKKQSAYAASSALAQAVEASGDRGFSLFHFYRPNRPANEYTKPLMKYFQHVPHLATVEAFGKGSKWTPKLNAPKRSSSTKATPLKPYVPPQSYLQGLYERQAVTPGNSYGRRSLMWGTWF
mmetsp:Transcript_53304/g.61194  ORF Transcript_53304/g.61194 Transcript_53304/m.61194 type:complete len:267 (-) Transcript_53304:45-845(-)